MLAAGKRLRIYVINNCKGVKDIVSIKQAKKKQDAIKQKYCENKKELLEINIMIIEIKNPQKGQKITEVNVPQEQNKKKDRNQKCFLKLSKLEENHKSSSI